MYLIIQTESCFLFFFILNLNYYSGYSCITCHGFSKISRTIFPSIFLFTILIHYFEVNKGVWQPILIAMMEGLVLLLVKLFLAIEPANI